tara:strand:- start:768 stop:905 length:138 start_codon:yes stop_codon:yes gene_type:complete
VHPKQNFCLQQAQEKLLSVTERLHPEVEQVFLSTGDIQEGYFGNF